MADSNGNLNQSCVWFDNINQMHDKIATLVRAFITDNIPDSIYEGQDEIANMYPEENTVKQFTTYLASVMEERKKALEELEKIGNKQSEKEE